MNSAAINYIDVRTQRRGPTGKPLKNKILHSFEVRDYVFCSM